ncbi:MAG: hypothetical protein CL581_03535 [Alteromonadaceae bacterium]|nr:hypothetical protein [Alteromonadaceae bacterium]|tara:strand:- start:980 stop:1705 length:726 start_codon:yes stop_codon:yes gene_type:complete
MTWVAAGGLVLSTAGSMLGTRAKKKAAKQQAQLAKEQAQQMRSRATEAANVTKAEIENLRVMRSMDMPAFRQASETALIQAQKGAERMARQRTMGRLAPDVRQAIFGGQFQQYVGREMQRLEQYAGLTQQIMQATERQQQIANQVEQSAGSLEYQGRSQAIQMEAEAGDETGQLLTAVGAAASQFAGAQSAKAAAATDAKRQFASDALLQEYGKEGKSLPFLEGGTINKDKLNTFFEGMGY